MEPIGLLLLKVKEMTWKGLVGTHVRKGKLIMQTGNDLLSTHIRTPVHS